VMRVPDLRGQNLRLILSSVDGHWISVSAKLRPFSYSSSAWTGAGLQQSQLALRGCVTRRNSHKHSSWQSLEISTALRRSRSSNALTWQQFQPVCRPLTLAAATFGPRLAD